MGPILPTLIINISLHHVYKSQIALGYMFHPDAHICIKTVQFILVVSLRESFT